MCKINFIVHVEISMGDAIRPIGIDFIKQQKSIANRNNSKSDRIMFVQYVGVHSLKS